MRRILFLVLTVSALCFGTVGMAFASTPSTAPVLADHDGDGGGLGGVLCPLVGGLLTTTNCDHRGGHYRGGHDTVIVTGGSGCAASCSGGAYLVPSYPSYGVNYGGCNSGCAPQASYGFPQSSYDYPVGAVATGDGSCYGRLSTVFRGDRFRGDHFRGGRFH